MKNIHTLLSEIGISIPEDKKAEFDKGFAENYKTSAEFEKKVTRLTDDLAAEKKRADDAVETLKGFEGKDFDAITRERDEWQRKHNELEETHRREAEDREFNSVLETAISDAKGKNAKAIMALLDIEKLRSSKNRDKDIKSALDDMRKESGYLFEDNGGNPSFAAPAGNPGGGTTTVKDIMSIKDPVERQNKIVQNMHLFKKG